MIQFPVVDSGKRYETRAYRKDDGAEVFIGCSDSAGAFRGDVEIRPDLTGWKELDRQSEVGNASTSGQMGH